jgi:hypothetical protein
MDDPWDVAPKDEKGGSRFQLLFLVHNESVTWNLLFSGIVQNLIKVPASNPFFL